MKIRMLQILLILLLSYYLVHSYRQLTEENVLDEGIKTQVVTPVMVFHSYRNSIKHPSLSEKEIGCIADMAFKEAVGEGVNGWIAVIHVALNRMDNDDFPKNACDVIYQRKGKICQYSWVCERGARFIARDSEEYRHITTLVRTISAVPDRTFIDPTQGSLYFKHVTSKSRWFDNNLVFTVQIGGHQFYIDS